MPATMTPTSEPYATHGALATGEVGLLSEEGAQRLLSIFSEFASLCLGQIFDLSRAHGEEKCQTLYEVGLDLVARWDGDVLHEETVRMETSYPEVSALHSFAYLWLLDRCTPERHIVTLSVPPLLEVYGIFMRRVAKHADVRSGHTYHATPLASRRAIFIDAFRGAYHDLLQRKLRMARTASGLPTCVGGGTAPSVQNWDASLAPEDAASEVAARLAAQKRQHYVCRSGDSATLPSGSILQTTMTREEGGRSSAVGKLLRAPLGSGVGAESLSVASAAPVEHDAQTDLAESALPGPPSSQGTRAVPVAGPCFFATAPEMSPNAESTCIGASA